MTDMQNRNSSFVKMLQIAALMTTVFIFSWFALAKGNEQAIRETGIGPSGQHVETCSIKDATAIALQGGYADMTNCSVLTD